MQETPVAAPEVNRQARVGIARREKTRALLIQSALRVFARKGPDLPVIDDFIAAAGVARGTFYNYFKTTGELLAAVAAEMSDEVLGSVDPEVMKLDDPAARVSMGTRLYVRMARRYPIWGEFLTRIGSRHAVRGKLLDVYLTRDIQLGIAEGRFSTANAEVARDIILGSIFYGIETLITEPDHQHHIEHMMCSVLHGLGLRDEEARSIAFMPLPELRDLRGPIFSQLVD